MSDPNGTGVLRVGDLAAATGLSVRALHHYEDVGLLTPSSRSAAGHRLYGPPAVERLYRISRLRRLGLSLEQIGRVLEDPQWNLERELQLHANALVVEAARLSALTHAVSGALARLAEGADPTGDLLEVVNTMDALRGPVRRRLSILVYADLRKAHDYLVDVLGMTAGELTETDDGAVVHAEVFAGDGVIWLHPESEEYQLASPMHVSADTALMSVMVDDVDEHYQAVAAKGGNIVYSPVDQSYGFREYGVRDPEGRLWCFMKAIDSIPAGEADAR